MEIAGNPQEPLRLCPDCGSPSVDYSTLEGGEAACKVCTWAGRKDSLLVVPVPQGIGSDGATLVSMYNSWRVLFRAFAKDIAQFLLEWGFLTAKEEQGKLSLNPKDLARYVATAASASLTAIVEERQKIEQEKTDGN